MVPFIEHEEKVTIRRFHFPFFLPASFESRAIMPHAGNCRVIQVRFPTFGESVVPI
jgi:hypothetical protein